MDKQLFRQYSGNRWRRRSVLLTALLGPEASLAAESVVQSGSAGHRRTGEDAYMVASTRNFFPGSIQVVVPGDEYATSAIARPAMPYRQISPRMCLANFFADGSISVEKDTGNDIFIEGVSFEIAGVRYPVKYKGQESFTIPNGSFVFTDEDDSIIIPADVPFREIVARYIPVGQSYPKVNRISNGLIVAGGLQDGLVHGNTSRVSYVSGTAAIQYGRGPAVFGACMSVAKGWAAAGQPAVVLVIGDSIGAGANDGLLTQNFPEGVTGFINRGLQDNSVSARTAFVNFSTPGVAYRAIMAGTFARRKALLEFVNYPFSCILSEMGTNAGGGNGAIVGYHAYGTFLKSLGNRRIIQTTMCAKASAIDPSFGFSNLDNQKVIDFQKFNGWVRQLGKRAEVINGTAYTTDTIDEIIDLGGVLENESPGDTRWPVAAFTTVTGSSWTYSGGVPGPIMMNAPPDLEAALWLRSPDGVIYSACFVTGVLMDTPSPGKHTVSISQYSLSPRQGVYPAGTVVTEINTVDGVHPNTNITKVAARLIGAVKLTALKPG